MDARDRRGGGGVVVVMADEYSVILIVEAAERCLQHRSDDRRFVPGGHQHRDEAGLAREIELIGVEPRVAAVHGQRTPAGTREIDEIDEHIVDAEQKEADAGEQRQLRRGAAKHFRNGHCRETKELPSLCLRSVGSYQPPLAANHNNRATPDMA